MAHSIEAEEEAVMRASTLANQVNCPLLLKGITSDTAADIVKVKKNRGNVLYAEVTPAALGQAHHMFSRFLIPEFTKGPDHLGPRTVIWIVE